VYTACRIYSIKCETFLHLENIKQDEYEKKSLSNVFDLGNSHDPKTSFETFILIRVSKMNVIKRLVNAR
jgi:hypothetical protein